MKTPSTEQIDGRFDDGSNPADLARPIEVTHGRPCCERDTDRDGNCDRHKAPATDEPYTFRELREALAESLRLQAHYARVLNDWDGGARVSFTSIDAWIARLRELGRFPALRSPDGETNMVGEHATR